MKFSEMPYTRVDFPAVIAQAQEIIQRASSAKSGEEQFEIHQEFNKLMDHVRTLYTIAHIRRDGDVTNEFYDGEKNYYDEKLPELNAVTNEYKKVLFATPYRQYMEEKIGPVAFKSMELEMKSFDDSLIPLMQEENALASRYSKLIASAKIMWEGEELNLSLMRKYMRSQDRNTRKKAWDAFSGFFEENQAELDEIYDLMVKNRTRQAQMLGFENYIDMGYFRMNRNSYTKEDVQKLREQIKTVFVPLASRMHKNRQARLGVDALRYYDMGVYFPQGDPAPIGTPEEILESGRKMYTEMSDETRDFFNMMMENELFDVFGRKNKATGGYMTELPDYGVPFIFANFNGTSGDVDVITHECGHAFQSYVSCKDPITDHSRYLTMETAEIHSMSMEFFAEPWIELFFGEEAMITARCTLRMPSTLFLMEQWWMNSSTLYTAIRSLHLRSDVMHGTGWSRSTAHIWIPLAAGLWKKAATGRDSTTFLRCLSTILIMYLHSFVHSSLRSAWRKIMTLHGLII